MLDLSLWACIYCVVVMLLAYCLRGSAGFGGAVAMPLMALVIPIKILIPAWTLMGIASAFTILGRERKHVAYRAVASFTPWCLVGIGLGLYVFASIDALILTRGLGLVILLYAGWLLWKIVYPNRTASAHPLARTATGLVAPLASAAAGLVGALFGTMASIFMAIYLDTQRLTKLEFRATVSAMLLLLSLVRGAGYFAMGEFSRDALLLFAAGVPLMMIGIAVGDRIHVRLSEAAFRKLICAALLMSGIPLLLK